MKYNKNQDQIEGANEFRPTILTTDAVPDHGEQAHQSSGKPKVITNCIHLSEDGRETKVIFVWFFYQSSISISYINNDRCFRPCNAGATLLHLHNGKAGIKA